MKIIRSGQLQFIPASHEDPKAPGVLKKVLLQRDDLIDGKIRMINWALLPAGKSFRAHYHEDMEEVFIILNGMAMIRIDKEETVLEKKDVVVVPIGKVHEMKNIGEEDVEYIVVGVSQEKGGKTVVV
ncbi:MAG: cupin domain-containing protein [Deltaproteobacteria bacterium]|nr:cupin domain-containing protein [Deltaproteobacteria bacterium]